MLSMLLAKNQVHNKMFTECTKAIDWMGFLCDTNEWTQLNFNV